MIPSNGVVSMPDTTLRLVATPAISPRHHRSGRDQHQRRDQREHDLQIVMIDPPRHEQVLAG